MEESPKKLLIGFVVGMMVVLSVMVMMAEMTKSNPSALGSTYSNFSEDINQYDALNESTSGLQGLVTGSSADDNAITTVVKALWNGRTLIFSSFGFIATMLNSFSDVLGLPTWIATLIVLIVTISLVFWLIDIIFRSA